MASLYKLYQKYQQIPGQPPLPLYPQQYSIDGEGTEVEQIKYSDYCLCGDINQMLTFWATVPNEYICKNCGEDEQMERWVIVDPSGNNDYYCEECPVVKLYATYSDSSVYSVDCNSASNLTRNEVRGNTNASYSAMTSAQIGGCISIIGTQAFYQCSSLTRVYIPSTITTIGQNAFARAGLTSVTIPDSVTSIDDGAFSNCQSLGGAYISTGLTTIPESMFETCTAMTNVTIPSSVTSIGNWAFSDCGRLTVTMEAITPPTLDLGAYSSTYNHFNNVLTIRVPAASVATYSTATGWSIYSSKIVGY